MELLLPIFLLSGQFKSYLNFFGIKLPLDLTLLSAFFIVVLLVYKLYMGQKLVTRQISYLGIGLLLVFYGWMIFSLFYTSSESYSRDKTFFFALNILAFAIPFASRGFNIRRFLRWFSIFTVMLSLFLIPFLFFMGKVWQTDAFSGYSAISGLYLSLAGYLGLTVVLYLTAAEPIWKNRRQDLVAVLFIILLMLLLGARGPVLFALLVFGLYYVYNLRAIRLAIGQRTLVLLIAGAFVLLAGVVLMLQFESTRTLLSRTLGRFFILLSGLFSGDYQDSSALVRLQLYGDAINGIFASLPETIFGHGVGSFGIETMGEDIRLYPHNMILEIWFEFGLIGLLLFAGWVVYLLSKTIRLPYAHISYWLLLYFFLNLMKSSSLVDIRTEFALFGLFITQHFNLQNEDSASG